MDRPQHSIQLDPQSFQAIASLAHRVCGIQLVAEKSSMIQSRLRHRVKAIGADSFKDYAAWVCSEAGIAERSEMISALTTNVSHFFREQHHFEILNNEILPQAIQSLKSGGRFRIWSAGCSNGQEAYSVAMTALEAFPDILNTNFRILATDIDPKVIRFASAGSYPDRLIAGVPKAMLSKYFDQKIENGEQHHIAKEALRSCITFKELNLLSEWPITGKIDVIYCRNVVIYFDMLTQNKLWPRFSKVLTDEGRLFLGHSERISDPAVAGFESFGPTTYRKTILKRQLPGKGTPDVA